MTTTCRLISTAFALALVVTACSNGPDEGEDGDDQAMDGSEDTGDGDGDSTDSPDLPVEDVTWAEVSAIFQDRQCSGCHGAIPDTYPSVVENWLEGPDGDVLRSKMEISHRITAADAQVVIAWIDAGYPET